MSRPKKNVMQEHAAIAEVKLIPLHLIDTLPQLRKEFDQESIEELATDIKEHGLLQPILLNPVNDRFQVIAGERRLRAVTLNGSTGIPALLVKTAPENTILMQLAENIQRENLSLDEECNAIVLLYENMGSLAKVAKTVRKSVPWCSKRFAITQNKLHFTARALLEEGITEDIELLKALSSLIELTGWTTGQEWIKKITQGEAGRNEVRAALKIAKEADKAEKEKQAARTEKTSHAKTKEPPPPPAWTINDAMNDLCDTLTYIDNDLNATELLDTWTDEQIRLIEERLCQAVTTGAGSEGFKTISDLVLNGVHRTNYTKIDLLAMIIGYKDLPYTWPAFLAQLQVPREKA